VGQPLPLLNMATLLRIYRQCTRRLILFGLDGTLIQQEKVIAHLKNFQDFQGHTLAPPPASLHCLRALCADPLNVVFVISGRSAADMEACLGNVDGLGLAAELGFVQRRPGDSQWTQQRQLTAAQANWHELAKPVLDRFTTRTNGAYLRWQESAALWCYQNADPDFGRFQAHQLTLALRERLRGAGICVSNSMAKGQVEVRVAGVNKGAIADEILRTTERLAPVDFVLCVGDDDDDEYMLSAVTARSVCADMCERLRHRLFTVTVGNKACSHANFVVQNSRDVLGILETLRTAAS
jgi:trehalose 6-phosphate synthase/phosphatase